MTYSNYLAKTVFSILLFSSCKAGQEFVNPKEVNKSANEKSLVMIGYQPIDPIQVHIDKQSDSLKTNQFLIAFPNEATRLAIGEINQQGTISFGPFSIAKAGRSYSVILDYIKYTTTNLPVEYLEQREINTIGDTSISILHQFIRTNYGKIRGDINEYNGKTSQLPFSSRDVKNKIKFPVYVGVGLRIQASITVLSDSVNLSSLFSIGLAASQKKLNGTLIIQTLGVSGENISPLMPLPDQINESTIQFAMQSLATIKSKIYDTDKTIISPQVLAFKLPFAIDGAKDLIESTLHTSPPTISISNRGKIEIIEAPPFVD